MDPSYAGAGQVEVFVTHGAAVVVLGNQFAIFDVEVAVSVLGRAGRGSGLFPQGEMFFTDQVFFGRNCLLTTVNTTVASTIVSTR